jgi:hypothetical protein
MAISRVSAARRQLRGSRCGSASRQSDTPDGFHRSKVAPRPAVGAGKPAPIADIIAEELVVATDQIADLSKLIRGSGPGSEEDA